VTVAEAEVMRAATMAQVDSGSVFMGNDS